jgi:integrase
VATPTWRETVSRFAQSNPDLQPKTIQNYLLCIEAHTFGPWADRGVDTISTEEIRQLVRGLRDKSASHQKNILKFIRWTLQYAVEVDLLKVNPTPKIRFRVGEKVKSVLTEKQVRQFLNSARQQKNPWYPIWAAACYTGMRTGELFALTKDKVCFETGQITVSRSWNKTDGFKSTKSGVERRVEMAKPLRSLLKELMFAAPHSEFVLPRLDKWVKGEQARVLRAYLRSIGLPEVKFHDLRATWATTLLSKGVPPASVMVMGGWKDMKTMMIYIRAAGLDTRGALDCLDFHDSLAPSGELLKMRDFADKRFELT